MQGDFTESGRLASVAGAVLAGPDAKPEDVERLAERLGHVCEEVLVVGAEPSRAGAARHVAVRDGRFPVSHWRAALETAESERVLVVAAGLEDPSEALLLALVAWPEADVVLPAGPSGGRPLCALYRRRLGTEHGEARSLDELVDASDASRLEAEDLARIDS